MPDVNIPEVVKGSASLIAAVALIVIASELWDDLVRPDEYHHFDFHPMIKVGLLGLTTFLIWEESAKARRVFTGPVSAEQVPLPARMLVASSS